MRLDQDEIFQRIGYQRTNPSKRSGNSAREKVNTLTVKRIKSSSYVPSKCRPKSRQWNYCLSTEHDRIIPHRKSPYYNWHWKTVQIYKKELRIWIVTWFQRFWSSCCSCKWTCRNLGCVVRKQDTMSRIWIAAECWRYNVKLAIDGTMELK